MWPGCCGPGEGVVGVCGLVGNIFVSENIIGVFLIGPDGRSVAEGKVSGPEREKYFCKENVFPTSQPAHTQQPNTSTPIPHHTSCAHTAHLKTKSTPAYSNSSR